MCSDCSESGQYICDWENKYNKQCELINQIITQYNTLKLNESLLKTKLKEMKELKECDRAELCCYKAEMEEKNGLIKKLNTNLKSMEEENYDLRKQITDVNSRFGMNSKFTTTKPLNSIKQNETTSKLEQNKLSTKFNIVCEKLYEMKTAFSDVENAINRDICHVENTVDTIKRLTEAETCKQKLLKQIRHLKDKNNVMEDVLTSRNNKIKELQRQNEHYVSKINTQKKQLQEWNLKKQNCPISKEICEQDKRNNNCSCYRQKTIKTSVFNH
eukprot:XP_016657543.1 PREDICTED: intracellular protein transport protein USO1-like [Acyrthosiphon pisum]